jgi:hypothetical protein
MGCTSCTSKGGCDTRKGEERELLSTVLPALYPDRRWGAPDDEARFRGGIREREGRSLARRASEALRAPAYFRPGSDGESCDYVYVLCVGRQPGLVELRDSETLRVVDGDRIEERYLRAALSSMARVAAVQEVSFELTRDPGSEVYVVKESPRDGIYDPILLQRTQSFIELLVKSDITYLDFGLLTKPVSRYAEGFDEDAYEEQYGQRPATVNYLFYPQPPTAVTTSWIPCATS